MLDLVSDRDAGLSADICLSEAFIRIAGFDVTRNAGLSVCQGCCIECLTRMPDAVSDQDAG